MSEAERAPRVALLVTGCIAAYKACEVLRLLQKAGCDVRVAMTASAERFVGPATFRALSGHEVVDDLFACAETAIPHIDLAEWADLMLVCPATADVLAKMRCGIADDAVSSTLLAATSPVLVAPAMNVHMWRSLATQDNVSVLQSRGIAVLAPDAGRLACGEVGEGKLPEVSKIAEAALDRLGCSRELAGRGVVVTAGPTHEAIDPVRYLSNASSGKMGYAIAAACAARGANVTLVSGPVGLAAPAGVRLVRVTSASEMLTATCEAFARADAAVLAAAVSDYRPATPADHKLKKASEPLDSIELVENPDILQTVSRNRGTRVVVGFAAETSDAIRHAREKLERKGCDFIVANDVSRPDSTFGSDTDRVAFVSAEGVEQLESLPKREVADLIASRVVQLLELSRPRATRTPDDGGRGAC